MLCESDEDFAIQVKKTSRPLEQHVNVWGHTALHLAVYQPSRVAYLLAAGHEVDPRDKDGYTPLMYAAQASMPETTIKLMEHGACLLTGNDDFITSVLDFVLHSRNWDLFWKILDFSATTEPNMTSQLIPHILPYFLDEECYSAHESDGTRNGCLNFWTRLVSKLNGPNTLFDDGATLMDFVRHPDQARALIELGFDKFNHRDDYGWNCLYSIVGLADLSLFRVAVAHGADINLRSNSGSSVLHKLLECIERSDGTDLVGLLGILDFLMDQGADIFSRDPCSCRCSSGDRLPGSHLDTVALDLEVGWLAWFECLEVLEERNMVAKAKAIALASLRRACFDETGLHHTSSSCHSFRSNDEAEDINDRFWDISERIKVDEFESRMRDLAERDYVDMKLEVMAFLRRSWMTARAGQGPIWKLERYQKVYYEKARMEILLPILNVMRVSILQIL